jgi:hypothetical protein
MKTMLVNEGYMFQMAEAQNAMATGATVIMPIRPTQQDYNVTSEDMLQRRQMCWSQANTS